MNPTDYKTVLENEFQDYASLIQDRKQTELKLAQKEQFIRATINMLPEEDREAWEVLLEALSDDEEVGLSDAIRGVLRATPKKYHTATEVKNALTQGNFDFSRYTSNPLSSVHAALKRLKADEVETEKIEGVMAWRWIGSTAIRRGNIADAFYGGGGDPAENSWLKVVMEATRPLSDLAGENKGRIPFDARKKK
jgi:hypothetical protein